jgi:hypothetical protein
VEGFELLFIITSGLPNETTNILKRALEGFSELVSIFSRYRYRYRYRAQSINAIWNQLPYFFHDMDDWFRDEKKPL